MIKQSDDKPFFLYLSHYAVHTPIQAKKEEISKYEAKARRMGIDQVRAIEEGDYFPCEHKKHLRIERRIIQSDPVYAAMVENLDWNIGRLLKVLEVTGKADDTVIFFTSDNGGLATAEGSPTCNEPLNEGKGWMYEGGVREPLIVKWPGITNPGSVCNVPVTSLDFYPTMLEIADFPLLPDQHVDGESFVSLLRGQNKLERDAIYWHYPHYGNQGGTPCSSIRMGDYKLIEFFEDGHVELYNLRSDISESEDLSTKEPELANTLQQKLLAWFKQVEAKMPEPNPDYVIPF